MQTSMYVYSELLEYNFWELTLSNKNLSSGIKIIFKLLNECLRQLLFRCFLFGPKGLICNLKTNWETCVFANRLSWEQIFEVCPEIDTIQLPCREGWGRLTKPDYGSNWFENESHGRFIKVVLGLRNISDFDYFMCFENHTKSELVIFTLLRAWNIYF